MLYIIFQFGWEPVLILRILIGFDAILEKKFSYFNWPVSKLAYNQQCNGNYKQISLLKGKIRLTFFHCFSPVNELKRILQSLVICVHKIIFLTIYFYYSDLPHSTSFLPWGHVPFNKERLRLCVCVSAV